MSINNSNTRLVVKDNALIEASFNLSLVEQRLMLLAIVEAREISQLTFETPIEIRVTDYIKQYSANENSAYNQLQEASNNLFNRYFSYYDKEKDKKYKERWVYKSSYLDSKGTIEIFFTPTVIRMISRLEAEFTKYLLEHVSEFNSKYSIRLFELISKWVSLGNTCKYGIDELRGKLGVEENEYKAIADLKKRVIDVAVKEINNAELVPFKLKYEQYKEGRTISHILFKIIKKKIIEPAKVIKFTEKQKEMFSDRLARNSHFQEQSGFSAESGENYQDYAKRIYSRLGDEKYINAWMSFLIEVGYK